MEQNFQQQYPPELDTGNNRQLTIAVVSVLITAIMVGFGAYFITRTFTNQSAQPQNNQITETRLESGNNQLTQENELTTQEIYFAKGWQGQYSLVNLDTGLTQDFIPDGYEIVNQHEYDTFPKFLILQKGNRLFSYEIENQLLNEIFSFNDLQLKENEDALIYPSITERSKFFIVINEFQPDDESGVGLLGLRNPISSRSYFFDASIHKPVRTNNIDFGGCAEYDSKNQRFFSWPCAEGIGSSIPLSILDLNGNKQREIISLSEFGLEPHHLGPVAVRYNNGLFFALPKGAVDRIVLVDPSPQEPKKETYTITTKVTAQIKDKSYPYSTAIAKSQNTFIIGGKHFITLLRYADNQIIESKTILEQELYANFIFPHNDTLYYQSRSAEAVRAIDLKTWRMTKSFPVETSGEVTLFAVSD